VIRDRPIDFCPSVTNTVYQEQIVRGSVYIIEMRWSYLFNSVVQSICHLNQYSMFKPVHDFSL
jgi:hypothetical protein